jgi:hypothetical protein
MSFIRRDWTAHEAEEWTKEDWIAIILSPFCYIFLCLGLAMSLFLLPIGFIFLSIGVILTIFMFYTINPKLTAISARYEEKQREYLKDLEKIQRWEER